MACYKFVPPEGATIADVLATAHRIRVEAGDYNVEDRHLAQAIEELSQRKESVVPVPEKATAG
jgi:hypothetical protein